MPASQAPAKQGLMTNGGLSAAGSPDLDPFSLVYRAVWNSLHENALFALIVPKANRGRWDSDRDPSRQNPQDANFPWVEIQPTGGVWGVLSSDSMRIVQTFDIEVEGSEPRVHRLYFPLKWALLQWATERQQDTRPGCGLDLPFVADVSFAASFEDRRQARSSTTLVWYHLLTVSVEMHLSRAGILEGAAR